MQGDQEVIDCLNLALTNELTAINQYFIQAKMCENWGYHDLAKIHYDESIGEMKHAEFLIDRILFLEGVPEIARYNVIRVGTTIPEQFANDLALEQGAVDAYNAGVTLCHGKNDHGSKDLLNKILVESEEHVDWLEKQIGLIDQVGLENYLMSQMGSQAPAGH